MTTRLITYAQTYRTNQYGQITLTDIIDVQAYRKVNVEIIQWPHVPVAMTVSCQMGKFSGSTLAAAVRQFSLGTAGAIHSFEVVGPEFNIVLTGGTPNTDVPIQAWVFLN
jgi:hypothetical protein